MTDLINPTPVSFDEFKKIDLRIGTITAAERVEESSKLLKLQINLGNETRQVIAGIGKTVEDPTTLVGQQIPIVANLEPKLIMGMESQGMILAADNSGTPILLHPATTVDSGTPIH